MKIEFLPDGSDMCPLIRLYDYQIDEVRLLQQACLDLAAGRISEFPLHAQAWIEPIAGCRFVWRSDKKNMGVNLPRRDREFALLHSDEGWLEVAKKLEHFTGEYSGGYNWLTNDGDVNVLISRDGTW